MLKSVFTLVVLLLFTTGCNEYYFKYNGTSGYSDLTCSDIIEVTYVGTTNFTLTDARRYALYRLASIAREKNISSIHIVDEHSENTTVQYVTPAVTHSKEHTDSTGTKTVATSTSPSYLSTAVRPSVTLRAAACSASTTENSSCISIEPLLQDAQREGIRIHYVSDKSAIEACR